MRIHRECMALGRRTLQRPMIMQNMPYECDELWQTAHIAEEGRSACLPYMGGLVAVLNPSHC